MAIIAITGLQETIKKLDVLGKIDVMPVITKGTFKVQGTAKKLVAVYGGQNSKAKPPLRDDVVKGALRESIHVRFDKTKKTGSVFSNLEYAMYQEFGTRYQVGTPFLTPALNQESKGIQADIENFLKSEIEKQ